MMMMMTMSAGNRIGCLGFSTTTTRHLHRRFNVVERSSFSSFSSSSLRPASSYPQAYLQKKRQHQQHQPLTYRNFVSKLHLELDEQGRTIRRRSSDNDNGGDNDGGDGDYDKPRPPRRTGGMERRTSNDWESSNVMEENRRSTPPPPPRRRRDDDDDDPDEFDSNAYDYSRGGNSNIQSRNGRDDNNYSSNNNNNNNNNNDNNDDAFDTWDGERPASTPRRGTSAPRRGGGPPPATNTRRRFGGDRNDNDTGNRWDGRSSAPAPRFGRRDSGDSGGGDRRPRLGGDRFGKPQFASSTPSAPRMGGERGGRFNAFPNNNNNNNINNRWSDAASVEEAAAIQQGRTNMKALENAGFVHLYGLSSCLNALRANQRDLTVPQEETDRILQLQQSMIDNDDEDDEPYVDPENDASRKPEAQLRSWLFVQQQQDQSLRSSDKAQMAEEILRLAQERNVPVAYVDRGVLNTLSGNRPHQGYVLRCGKLSFEPLSRIPLPESSSSATKLWLVLDEVVDPQNLGALIRTSYFLGNVGLLVCAKNSAPPSAVVSAASVGALEVATIYSTANLPRTLQQAQQDGFRIIGASSSPPTPIRRAVRNSGGDDDEEDDGEQGADNAANNTPTNGPPVYDLQDLPITSQPTLLVLGSEGHGLRTLVARACTEFVRIPSGNTDDNESVDSLNVSVTGGILLWHLLHGQRN